jgi:AraC-like DNA-binding protein
MTIHFLHSNRAEIEFVLIRQQNITYPEHNHVSVYTIVCVLQGCVQLKQNKKNCLYQKNEQFVISPYLPHQLSLEEDASILSICIKTSYLNTDGLNKLAEILQQDFYLLKQQYSIELPSPDILVEKLKEKYPQHLFTKTTDAPITQIRQQIEQTPENILFDWKNLSINQYRFIRLFKKNAGLSPQKFLIQNRVRKAQQLLLNSQLPLTQVAQETGFYDQSHFIRHFKTIMRLTPVQYQQSIKGL